MKMTKLKEDSPIRLINTSEMKMKNVINQSDSDQSISFPFFKKKKKFKKHMWLDLIKIRLKLDESNRIKNKTK